MYDTDRESSPRPARAILKFLTLTWVTEMIHRITADKMQIEDALKDCQISYKSKKASERLERLWAYEVEKRGRSKASLMRVLLKFDTTIVLICVFGNVILALSMVASSTICVKAILHVIQTEVSIRSIWISIPCCLAFSVTMIIQSMSQNATRVLSELLGCKLGTALTAVVYRKVLRLSNAGQDQVGALLNIFSADIYRFTKAMSFGQAIWAGTCVIPMVMLYLFVEYNKFALLGMIAIVFSTTVLLIVVMLLRRYKRKIAKATSERLSLTSELLQNMMYVKVQCREDSAVSSVLECRKKELKYLFPMRVIESGLAMSSNYCVVFLQIVFITAYIFWSEEITSTQVFSITSLLVCIQNATRLMSRAFRFGSDIFVAVQNIEDVLQKPEHKPPKSGLHSHVDVSLTMAHFSFEEQMPTLVEANEDQSDHRSRLLPKSYKSYYSVLDDIELRKSGFNDKKLGPPALKGLTFEIEKGSLIGVCGKIGTGKTSLLRALLGRLYLTSGSMCVNESIAYLPQTPWVINATIKENIIFGYPFDLLRYQYVVDVCCLRPDINLLPAGDDTEVGERGVNLSGGQKQRLSLARALYSDREMYLLDDPFSAVDHYVAEQLFKKSIREALKHKTVLLVTHRVKVMSECDHVLFVKGSQVIKSNHETLLLHNEQYRQLLTCEERITLEKQSENLSTQVLSATYNKDEKKEILNLSGRITTDEVQDTSMVGWETVWSYLKLSGSLWKVALYIIFIIGTCFVSSFSSLWLRYWFQNYSLSCDANSTICSSNSTSRHQILKKDTSNFWMNFTIFISTFEIMVLFGLLSSIAIAMITSRASRNLHKSFLERVVYCPMSFFNSTPVGRLQNLLSSDLSQIDTGIPYDCDYMVSNIVFTVLIVSVLVYISPWNALALLPTAAILYYCFSRAWKPLQKVSPVEKSGKSRPFGLLSSTLAGLECIAAFDKTQQFTDRFCEALDKHFVSVMLPASFVRWLAYRLDLITVCFSVVVPIALVFLQPSCTVADAGLALTLILPLSFITANQSHHLKENLSHFGSVKRFLRSTETLTSELSSINPTYKPGKDWPEKGEILIHNLWLKYQPHLPNVLKNVRCHIRPGEKVGIIGRTGAGKSSLMAAIFRLTEVSLGGIFVDGIDVATVPLKVLRSQLTMISQDPTLLLHTIRSNLVGAGEDVSDGEIWKALEMCHLANTISALPGGLDEVIVNGSNLSVGEKQLLCMTRAVLNNSKVMLLDEATASMDPQTDSLVQQTLRECFRECTMLIIAHRLNTVLDCDRILIMEDGQSVEFDTPKSMLANPRSRLHQLKKTQHN